MGISTLQQVRSNYQRGNWELIIWLTAPHMTMSTWSKGGRKIWQKRKWDSDFNTCVAYSLLTYLLDRTWQSWFSILSRLAHLPPAHALPSNQFNFIRPSQLWPFSWSCSLSPLSRWLSCQVRGPNRLHRMVCYMTFVSSHGAPNQLDRFKHSLPLTAATTTVNVTTSFVTQPRCLMPKHHHSHFPSPSPSPSPHFLIPFPTFLFHLSWSRANILGHAVQ